jgi:predicted DNA-binding transcriptional regulator AlpA
MDGGLLDGFLTQKQLAAELGVKPGTIKNWRKRHCGPPPTRIGKAIFYRRSSVLTWISAHESPPERGRPVAGRQRRLGSKP